MQNIVDVVGLDAISTIMEAAKLCRFRIYKETDGKGSLPTYESVGTTQNAKAIGAFRNWAQTALSNNPYNSQVYSMYLYGKPSDADDFGDDDDDAHLSKRKKDKIRFSFALTNSNPFMGQQAIAGEPFPDIKAAVQSALSEEREKTATEELRDEFQEFKKKQEEKEEEELGKDEPEVEETFTLKDFKESLGSVADIFRDFKDLSNKKAAMAGDEDDDDDLDDDVINMVKKRDIEDVDYEEVKDEKTSVGHDDDLYDDDEEPEGESEIDEDEVTEKDIEPVSEIKEKRKYTKEQRTYIDAKRGRMEAAMRILLAHNKNMDKDLVRLAKLAEKKPKMFKMLINSLRAMDLN